MKTKVSFQVFEILTENFMGIWWVVQEFLKEWFQCCCLSWYLVYIHGFWEHVL